MLLRSLTENDFAAWHEVRTRCAGWLAPVGAPSQGRAGTDGGPPELRRALWHPGARAAPRNRLRVRDLRGRALRGRGDAVVHSAGAVPERRHRLLGRRGDGRAGPRARGRRGRAALRLRGHLAAPRGDRHHPEEHGQPACRREAGHARGGDRLAVARDRRAVGGPRPLRHHGRGVGRARARARSGVARETESLRCSAVRSRPRASGGRTAPRRARRCTTTAACRSDGGAAGPG